MSDLGSGPNVGSEFRKDDKNIHCFRALAVVSRRGVCFSASISLALRDAASRFGLSLTDGVIPWLALGLRVIHQERCVLNLQMQRLASESFANRNSTEALCIVIRFKQYAETFCHVALETPNEDGMYTIYSIFIYIYIYIFFINIYIYIYMYIYIHTP